MIILHARIEKIEDHRHVFRNPVQIIHGSLGDLQMNYLGWYLDVTVAMI